MEAVDSNQGGTGKTYLINLLLARIRSYSHIALAVASSGIAAILLKGGQTSHSVFKLPLNLARSEQAVCTIKKGTAAAKLLRCCNIIVWDKCTMSHKYALEAVDRIEVFVTFVATPNPWTVYLCYFLDTFAKHYL